VYRCLVFEPHRCEGAPLIGRFKAVNIRSIIPLPDPTGAAGPAYLPRNLEDFPAGTQVLGLYPETTSFYRATVISAPYPGTGMGKGVRMEKGKPELGAKKGKYRVEFVDDDGAVREVDAAMVVKVRLDGRVCADGSVRRLGIEPTDRPIRYAKLDGNRQGCSP